jgi:protoheme IX farnesyltransferase
MLPVVKGSAATAKVIFVNTLLLTAVSILPVFFGMGMIYLIGALVGGTLFTYSAFRLTQVPEPTKQQAMQVFFASLIQLALLMSAAMLDVLVSS